MSTVFELPRLIGDLIVNQHKFISNDERVIRADLLNMFNQLYYLDRYSVEDDQSVVYYEHKFSTEFINGVGNVIGAEPVYTKEPKTLPDNFNNVWMILPRDSGIKRIILFGNNILRANFELTDIVDIPNIDSWESYSMLLGQADHHVRRVVASLASLYRMLIEEHNSLISMKTMYSSANDATFNNFFYLITNAMAIGTMMSAYDLIVDVTDITPQNDKEIAFNKLYTMFAAYVEYNNRIPVFPTRRPTGTDPEKIKARYIEILQKVTKFFTTPEVQNLRVGEIVANILSRIMY